jgi:hypothetical protein
MGCCIAAILCVHLALTLWMNNTEIGGMAPPVFVMLRNVLFSVYVCTGSLENTVSIFSSVATVVIWCSYGCIKGAWGLLCFVRSCVRVSVLVLWRLCRNRVHAPRQQAAASPGHCVLFVR